MSHTTESLTTALTMLFAGLEDNPHEVRMVAAAIHASCKGAAELGTYLREADGVFGLLDISVLDVRYGSPPLASFTDEQIKDVLDGMNADGVGVDQGWKAEAIECAINALHNI